MTKFELALKELDEEWLATLPDVEAPACFQVSRRYLMWEQRVIYGKKSTGAKVIKVVALVAALLVVLSIVALSTTKGREFVMHFFKESAVYSLEAEQYGDVGEMNVHYLPSGYELERKLKDKVIIKQEYVRSKNWIVIQKNAIETTADFDYSRGFFEQIEHNGTTYTISFVDNNVYNIIWNYHDCYYQVSGNIDKETALKIAFGVE